MNLLKHECDFFWLYQEEDKEDDDFEQPRTFKTRKGGSSQPAKQVWLKEKGVWLKEALGWQVSEVPAAPPSSASTQDDTG